MRGVRDVPPVSLVEGLTRQKDLTRPKDWVYSPNELESNMSAEIPDRASALALLESWVENNGLRKHMLAVEASVRHYARIHGEDEDLWGTAGLLHDLDGRSIRTSTRVGGSPSWRIAATPM